MDMHSGVPAATGNHVTGSDYDEQVRATSSMPAKKRLAVKYRDDTQLSHDDSSKPPPTGVAAIWQYGEDLLDDEKSVDDNSLHVAEPYVHSLLRRQLICVPPI